MDIKGSIRFNQQDASSNLFLNVLGVSGLQTGFHGFHIHENGDCTDPGSHFNPMMVCLNEIINQVSRLDGRLCDHPVFYTKIKYFYRKNMGLFEKRTETTTSVTLVTCLSSRV